MCGGAGTFQQALKDANTSHGPDAILFAHGPKVDAWTCDSLPAPIFVGGKKQKLMPFKTLRSGSWKRQSSRMARRICCLMFAVPPETRVRRGTEGPNHYLTCQRLRPALRVARSKSCCR